jgi:hypothetical protein
VLVTAGIFEMRLGPKETIGSEEFRVNGGHSFGTIVKVSTLDAVQDIEVLGKHRSAVLRVQDIGEAIWSARRSRDRLDVIERTQIIVIGWSRFGDVKIKYRHHAMIKAGIICERSDFLLLVHTREKPEFARRS